MSKIQEHIVYIKGSAEGQPLEKRVSFIDNQSFMNGHFLPTKGAKFCLFLNEITQSCHFWGEIDIFIHYWGTENWHHFTEMTFAHMHPDP